MLHDVVQGCPSVCLSFDYILPAVIFVERYVDNVDNSILVLKHINIRWDRMDLYLNISAINMICICKMFRITKATSCVMYTTAVQHICDNILFHK